MEGSGRRPPLVTFLLSKRLSISTCKRKPVDGNWESFWWRMCHEGGGGVWTTTSETILKTNWNGSTRKRIIGVSVDHISVCFWDRFYPLDSLHPTRALAHSMNKTVMLWRVIESVLVSQSITGLFMIRMKSAPSWMESNGGSWSQKRSQIDR